MPVLNFDNRACFLGEGPFWHPLRGQIFWFDVLNSRLLSRESKGEDYSGAPLEWQFDQITSAAGWIDYNHLLIASESELFRFNIDSGEQEHVVALEADNQGTRSNDGRADPYGGFWIGTMGKSAESEAGAIYRYYQGELRQIHGQITIPNSICFSPDGEYLYFTDGPKKIIFRQALDSSGWPCKNAEPFIDLRSEKRIPDGSVVDSQGAIWNAQWGSGRVARYLSNGSFDQAVEVPGKHSSCPAFGGSDMTSLFITTAQEHIEHPSEHDGMTYCFMNSPFTGIAEPSVKL